MLLGLALTVLASAHLAPADARRTFLEAKALCAQDHGKLWGESLCGPLLIVDPATRTAIGNVADGTGQLASRSGVFVGSLPPSEPIANTALTWSGVTWTEVMWPLPGARDDRRVLLAHEAFHRIQARLGVPLAGSGNAHLDQRIGRIRLQLEWAALERALLAHEATGRREAISDALLFRAARRLRFPNAAAEENALELGEGLAQYTGVRLAFADVAPGRAWAAHALHQAPTQPTFVRSFAYASGPAYGLLLDAAEPTWRTRVGSIHDLGEALRLALHLEPSKDVEAASHARAAAYGGERIEASEALREQKRLALERSDRARLLDGPVLRIPNARLRFEFDPRSVRTLEGAGMVYPTMRVTGDFGVLSVSEGALVDPQWRFVVVPAPTDAAAKPLAGPGWKLELASGWSLVPGARTGDYELRAAH
jgi:hypothetical protein